jgi:hypothetical protein
MEEKLGQVTALEEQTSLLSKQLSESRSKLAAFEQAAAEERARRLARRMLTHADVC